MTLNKNQRVHLSECPTYVHKETAGSYDFLIDDYFYHYE